MTMTVLESSIFVDICCCASRRRLPRNHNTQSHGKQKLSIAIVYRMWMVDGANEYFLYRVCAWTLAIIFDSVCIVGNGARVVRCEDV